MIMVKPGMPYLDVLQRAKINLLCRALPIKSLVNMPCLCAINQA